MIKVIAAAGAALAAAPYLAKASMFTQQATPAKLASAGTAPQLSAQRSSQEPLILVVKGDQVLGYRGLEEMPVRDASLAAMLNNAFVSKGGSN
jgi:hypothetical protein